MVHNVRTNGSLEHSRERDGSITGLAGFGEHADNLTGSLVRKSNMLVRFSNMYACSHITQGVHANPNPFVVPSIHPSIPFDLSASFIYSIDERR
jgi:hypothetical protein